MSLLNETHDPALRSWVAEANQPGSDFPIQNRVGALFYDGASLRGRSASCLLGCGRLPTVNRL